MFSVKGDLVLDPFVGSGTTILAAMCAGRDSLGVEIEEVMIPTIQAGVSGIIAGSNRRILERLYRHQSFVEECRRNGRELKHINRHYGFPVISRQEREILINHPASVKTLAETHWKIEYSHEAGLTLEI
jgi:hypothetical protein